MQPGAVLAAGKSGAGAGAGAGAGSSDSKDAAESSEGSSGISDGSSDESDGERARQVRLARLRPPTDPEARVAAAERLALGGGYTRSVADFKDGEPDAIAAKVGSAGLGLGLSQLWR